MYHIIAVDDEIKALERFERIISNDPHTLDLVTFSNPEEAIDYCRSHIIDVAFLDIDMPKIQGLRLAGILRESNPLLDIVFVTAYDQYALEAFHIHAYDYLLKPISNNDIKELFEELDLRNSRIPAETTDKTLYVQCFGSFLCYTGKNKKSRLHFRTSKTEELFAYLIQNNAMAVSKEQIIDKLWPEVDVDKAANYFRVSCSYLRKALEDNGFPSVLIKEGDNFYLDHRMLDCDLYHFMSMVKTSKKVTVDFALLEEASNLFVAPYLEDKAYDWSTRYNTWLENEYKYIMNILADEYIRQGDYAKAYSKYKTILLNDPFDEETLTKYINQLKNAGDTTTATIIYQKYKENLWKELQLYPSDKLQKIMNS